MPFRTSTVLLVFLAGSLLAGGPEGRRINRDFEEASEVRAWRVVNDGVMGGVSRSRFESRGNTAVFRGELSLENNGGFASVRLLPRDLELGGSRGVALRVRGDGKTYPMRLRTHDRFDGIAYTKRFETREGDWIRVRLPFDAFEATFRGRRVPGAPALEPDAIRQIGFLIADEQEGPFALEIDWIRATEPRRRSL